MASSGHSPPRTRVSLRLIFALGLLTGWTSASYAQCRKVEIGAVPLDEALLTLARQTQADIATTETGLHRVHVKPVNGCLTLSRALDRLMRDSGYRAVPAGTRGYRIVKAAAPRRPSPPPDAMSDEAPDIIVTGTKQQVPLLRFPGSVHIVDGRELAAGIRRSATLDDLAEMSPIMQKTDLGTGRNKLFIRGISDSSFNGPTQATATIYFGDVQLNHSGPEPALHLVDMERVEILEGPQETLYGAGTISGIIRLAPHAVALDRVEAFANGGGTFTTSGAPGFDSAAMVNIPVMKDVVGIRMVGYRTRDGGYVDDTLRQISNINRTDTLGGRVRLHIEPGGGWSFEGGVLSQSITADDAGYIESIAGPDARKSFLAQPYSSGITLWHGVLHKTWDSGLEMVSATGVVKTSGNDTFDATRLFPWLGPTVYQITYDGLQLSQETRFSHTVGGVSWVAGIALLYDREAQRRVIGPAATPFEIIGVTNVTRSASVFGEVTFPVTRRLSITAGTRASVAQTQGDPSLTPRSEPTERGFPLRRFQPAVALSWLVAPRTALFARLQTGYRTGGLAVARGFGRVAAFLPDSITVAEVGMRREREGARGIAFSTAVSVAHWENIQADLYSRFAQPYTDNIGGADIAAVEGSGDWIFAGGWRASFAFLWTQNRTTGQLAGTSTVQNRHLPNTPPFSSNLGIEYQFELGEHRFGLGAMANYVGRSVLGTGSFLDLSQGNYAAIGAAATWRWRRFEASLNIDNIANEDASKFAMGNPLTFGFREQYARQRPRSVRIGLGAHW